MTNARPRSPRLLLAALGLCLALVLAACSDEPVRVGFVGPLTGKYSDLGVQGRNGAMLAVEQINARGGIGGRPLELLVRDDANDAGRALEVDRQLIDAGVTAVIGHMTSAMSVAALPVMEQSGTVFVSPTTSTPLLSGRADHFFRVVPSNAQWAEGLATYSRRAGDAKTAVVVRDADNPEYSVPYTDAFAREFSARGGRLLDTIEIYGSSLVSWTPVLDRIRSLSPDIVVTALSARDLAALARGVTGRHLPVSIYSSMWGHTRELIIAGGRSVEGIVFCVGFYNDMRAPAYRAFHQAYLERFGYAPSFAAALTYESATALAMALEHTGGSSRKLAETLISLGPIAGLGSSFTFDEYGDVKRPSYIVTIANRDFALLDKVQAQ